MSSKYQVVSIKYEEAAKAATIVFLNVLRLIPNTANGGSS